MHARPSAFESGTGSLASRNLDGTLQPNNNRRMFPSSEDEASDNYDSENEEEDEEEEEILPLS